MVTTTAVMVHAAQHTQDDDTAATARAEVILLEMLPFLSSETKLNVITKVFPLRTNFKNQVTGPLHRGIIVNHVQSEQYEIGRIVLMGHDNVRLPCPHKNKMISRKGFPKFTCTRILQFTQPDLHNGWSEQLEMKDFKRFRTMFPKVTIVRFVNNYYNDAPYCPVFPKTVVLFDRFILPQTPKIVGKPKAGWSQSIVYHFEIWDPAPHALHSEEESWDKVKDLTIVFKEDYWRQGPTVFAQVCVLIKTIRDLQLSAPVDITLVGFFTTLKNFKEEEDRIKAMGEEPLGSEQYDLKFENHKEAHGFGVCIMRQLNEWGVKYITLDEYKNKLSLPAYQMEAILEADWKQ